MNYVGGTQERVLRSSTYFIKIQGELAGLLCVNIEVDHLLQGIDILRQALILDRPSCNGRRPSIPAAP